MPRFRKGKQDAKTDKHENSTITFFSFFSFFVAIRQNMATHYIEILIFTTSRTVIQGIQSIQSALSTSPESGSRTYCTLFKATTESICIDPNELRDARWMSEARDCRGEPTR